jgi:hypothetical protein
VSGQYFYKINDNFLPISGGTVTGDSYFNASLSANTFYSGSTNLEDIFLTSTDISGTTLTEGSNINLVQNGLNYKVSVQDSPSFNNVSFSGEAFGGNIYADTITGETYYVNNKIEPLNDNSVDIGSSSKRFRNINTVSGASTFWTASTEVYTQNLNLGNDLLGNSRIITANNSVIQDDTLFGGTY